ncbi:XK-related protein [Aphis craccivora]|uniref:XK-related protein n=1 Tax=Aphis craccivora TaxID=307492 RepID=A0A6G0ZER0_APHCR|nr:XK-related protein [Aphis craccivora]
MAQYEFLPLCDVLFNIISLAAYFCDIVFDVVMGYALYSHGRYVPFVLTMLFVGASATVEQTMSLRWYLAARAVGDKSTLADRLKRSAVQALHFVQLGVLWRYFKLFLPVDLRYVKFEVRDLCMLRLLHAFCESMPLLLLQSYLLWTDGGGDRKHLRDLNKVAVTLSTVSVCWALASFGKNVRMQNVHRLVLTWLGVIFQFLWRLGTVGARVISLTAYAAMYKYWVLLVLGLHWLSMLLWLHSPKNVFHGERMSPKRKAFLFALLAFVFTFEYVNLLENNHREKMLMFYVVMALENALLMFVWSIGSGDAVKPFIVLGLFCCGLVFMAIYYQFFHVRRLKYESGGRLSNATNSNNSTAKLALEAKYKDQLNVPNGKTDLIRRHSFSSVYENIPPGGFHNQAIASEAPPSLQRNQRYYSALPASVHNGIPGVFNCRFTNPYVAAMQKRKKKKPTTFVPPPSGTSGRDSVAFWCKPPPSNHSQQGSSENESASSHVDIRQKLQEKRQNQLAELRAIEEEIRQGKLKEPTENGEVLLSPQGYLQQQNWIAPPYSAQDNNAQPNDQVFTLMYKSYKSPSDLDSQISLPRSYTLPREFKFYRKVRPRKTIRSDHFVASTNSSDGDVDSGDDESDTSQPNLSPRPLRLPDRNALTTRHETKL